LVGRVGELIASLDDRKRGGNSFVTEFRADLVDALTGVFGEYFPDLKAKRGSYDKTKGNNSPYAEFIRMCSEEIFPHDRAPSGRIIDDITKLPSNR
jgi:hypothetical protein